MATIGCAGFFVAGGLPHPPAAASAVWILGAPSACTDGRCSPKAGASCAAPLSPPQGACVMPRGAVRKPERVAARRR